jgi:hypothetical protein
MRPADRLNEPIRTMRILITNEHLDQRPGTDLLVRDLARALQRRGHFVIAYSSDMRIQPRMLERDLIAVTTDLARLPFRPDVIHARHHLDAMTALIALPGVPAVLDALGGGDVGTIVPVHPRLHRYVVAAGPGADSMIAAGVPFGNVVVSDFGVDLARFAQLRGSSSGRPRRAAVYDDYLSHESPVVVAIEASLSGGDLDLIGRGFGRVVDDPERRLPAYDVVFARGVRAVEAMACGCAVVIVNDQSCGSQVTMANLDRMRSAAFALSAAPAASAAAIRACVDGIAAHDAAAVATAVRGMFGFDALADRYVAAYEAAIEANLKAEAPWDVEQIAISSYLRTLASAIKEMDTEQKNKGDLPLITATNFLDVSAALSAIQADLARPHWWPDQRPPRRPADGE